MASTLAGGTFDIERGPDWLFIRPTQPTEIGQTNFADQVWSMIECHMVHRCVLELDEIKRLDSSLVGQLVNLKKRIHQIGGTLRLCGLDQSGQEVLRICRLGDQLHSFSSRADAVLGPRPTQPR